MGEAFSSSFLAMVQYMNDDTRAIRGMAEAASDEEMIAELASSWMADLVAFQGDAAKANRLMAPAWHAIKAKEPTADPRYGGVLNDKAHAALVAATIEWIGTR